MAEWLQIIGVYRVFDTVTQKSYVGSSDHCDRRLRRNRHCLTKGVHSNKPLQDSWNLHGPEAFVFEILEMTSEEGRLDREQWWIDDLVRRGFSVFNLRRVGKTRKGIPQPSHVKDLLKSVHSGVAKSPEHKAKISASRKGQSKSPEHRERLREAALRQFSDPEARLQAAIYGRQAKRTLKTPMGPPWYVYSIYRSRLHRKNLPADRYQMVDKWIKAYCYRLL